MTVLRCITTLLFLLFDWAYGGNILVLTPYEVASHWGFFKPVIKELANRGHQVTYWSGFEWPENISNVTVLYSEDMRELNSRVPIDFAENDPLSLLLKMPGQLREICTHVYKDAIFHQLASTKTRYDVIIVEALFNECVYPLIHRLGSPFVFVNAVFPAVFHLDALGAPMELHCVPSISNDFTDLMNIWQRLKNVFDSLILIHYRRFAIIPVVDQMIGQVFNDTTMPRVQEIEKNVSMFITNAHFSINYHLPTTARIVQAGGLHIRPAKALQQDLNEFVNNSGDAGFIIVSFGSLLTNSRLPLKTRQILAATLGRLQQRVVWKWENELGIPNLASNIKLLPYLPQQDLLAHAKIRLFISHGGLFSNQESVYHNVPIIGLPIFGDQFSNMKKAEQDGYAICLDWMTITEDMLYDAIQQILLNDKYRKNVARISSIMRDQGDPLDRAVSAIEYVIRHDGAKHLRTVSADMSLYQRYLIDVIFILLCLSALILYIACRLLIFLCKLSRYSFDYHLKIE